MSKKQQFKVTGADYEIAKMQLARLRQVAEDRMLTFEEAKIYDILVRNLKVAKNDPEETKPVLSEKDRKLLDAQDAELLEIAMGPVKEPVGSGDSDE